MSAAKPWERYRPAAETPSVHPSERYRQGPQAPTGWSGENYKAPARGIAKGVYNTFAGATRLLAPIPAKVGLGSFFPPLRDAPVEENESMGATVGETLPYLAPGGPVRGVVGALAQGAKAGAVAASQGRDPALSAALGAAGPAVGPLVGKAVKTFLPEGTKQYAQALGATTTANKQISAKIVPDLIRRGVHGSREELRQIAGKGIEESGAKLDVALAAIPPGKAADVGSVLNHLQKLKKQYVVPSGTTGSNTIVNKEAYRNLSEVQMLVAGTQPTFESVRRLRQILDEMVTAGDKTFGRTIAEGSKLDATREAANAIRSELGKEFPNVALINKEFSFWMNVDRVVGATQLRTASQSTGIGQQFAGAVATPAMIGAAASGQVGTAGAIAIPVLLRKLVQSPAWRTMSAVQKDRLAQAVARGDAQAVGRITGMSAAGMADTGEGE